jgi:hypothetical protein
MGDPDGLRVFAEDDPRRALGGGGRLHADPVREAVVQELAAAGKHLFVEQRPILFPC